MMNIKFSKIPLLAVFFYLSGFSIIGFSLWLFYEKIKWLDSVQLQQLFILGALVVTIGSAINIFTQFKKKQK